MSEQEETDWPTAATEAGNESQFLVAEGLGDDSGGDVSALVNALALQQHEAQQQAANYEAQQGQTLQQAVSYEAPHEIQYSTHPQSLLSAGNLIQASSSEHEHDSGAHESAGSDHAEQLLLHLSESAPSLLVPPPSSSSPSSAVQANAELTSVNVGNVLATVIHGQNKTTTTDNNTVTVVQLKNSATNSDAQYVLLVRPDGQPFIASAASLIGADGSNVTDAGTIADHHAAVKPDDTGTADANSHHQTQDMSSSHMGRVQCVSASGEAAEIEDKDKQGNPLLTMIDAGFLSEVLPEGSVSTSTHGTTDHTSHTVAAQNSDVTSNTGSVSMVTSSAAFSLVDGTNTYNATLPSATMSAVTNNSMLAGGNESGGGMVSADEDPTLAAAATMANMDMQTTDNMTSYHQQHSHDIEKAGLSTDESRSIMLPSVALKRHVIQNILKENQPRKSERLQTQRASGTERRTFKQTYDINTVWCEECFHAYDASLGCTTHIISPIMDKPILSRARASLPAVLEVQNIPLSDTTSTPQEGVFAKRNIPARTMFGPFVAPHVDLLSEVKSKAGITYKLDQPTNEGGGCIQLDTSNEEMCNWMMFVRAARSYVKQNLVAFQSQHNVYFLTTKTIFPQEELKVWYAANYASRMQAKTLEQEFVEQQMQARHSEVSLLTCALCQRCFKTTQALASHMNEQHADVAANDAPGIGQHEWVNMNTADDTDSDTSAVSQVSLKRRRYMKKYRNTLKRSIRSLHKQRDKVATTSNEWECQECDLTFVNASLLNLHILTHAAENVQQQETEEKPNMLGLEVANNASSCDAGESLSCPVCNKTFANKILLGQHVTEHGVAKLDSKMATATTNVAAQRQHGVTRQRVRRKQKKCDFCAAVFKTDAALEHHMSKHDAVDLKPFKCPHCPKRTKSQCALAVHLKTHSDEKYFRCAVCHNSYDSYKELVAHADDTHRTNHGVYPCTQCHRSYKTFIELTRHMNAFHGNKQHKCEECGKTFINAHRLRAHSMIHTGERPFMCHLCGKRFNRKDKLKDHTQRVHSEQKQAKLQRKLELATIVKPAEVFVPKVPPTEYERYIYKCQICKIGFKRRGMLVNHLAKRHQDIQPESIQELNLPILRTQKSFFCQYCNRVYRSNAKRKAHIIKAHPEMPYIAPGEAVNAETTNGRPCSELTGYNTVLPQSCLYCHKQYATRAKVINHQRLKHPGKPLGSRPTVQGQQTTEYNMYVQQSNDGEYIVLQQEGESQDGNDASATHEHQMAVVNGSSNTDALALAMTELVQSYEIKSDGVMSVADASTVDVSHLHHAAATVASGGIVEIPATAIIPQQATAHQADGTAMIPVQNVSAVLPNTNEVIYLTQHVTQE